MGSNETATATTGGPRVIDVFDGNGAPSGPNCTLFSDVDRLLDSLRDRSGVGWSPRPHAPILGAPQRALDRKLWGLVQEGRALPSTLLDMLKRRRTRRRRLHVSSIDPRRPPGGLRTTILTGFQRRGRRGGTVNRELKNLFFSTPRKCPIDLFGPVANRTLAKRVRSRVDTGRSARCWLSPRARRTSRAKTHFAARLATQREQRNTKATAR